MKKKTDTYRVSLMVDVRLIGPNKRIARREITGLSKHIRNLTAGGFSPVHGNTGYEIVGVTEWPKAGYVSNATIAKEEIRIVGISDLNNMLATGAFEDQSNTDVENLFEWLANNAPESPKAFLPQFLREQLEPIAQHVADHIKVAEIEKSVTDKPIALREVYEEAARDFRHPDFAVFVKIETPIRMYRPDGDYESSWSYTRGLYGFGNDYETAVRQVYRTVLAMRELRLI